MMVTALEPIVKKKVEKKRLSAFLADDEQEYTELVALKLTGAGIEIIAQTNTVESAKNLEGSAAADIIVLDVRFEESTAESIKAAIWLKEQNPFRAIFFLTQVPEALNDIEWPVNFILDKSKTAANQLDQIALMILVHDFSLALLSELTELSKISDREFAESKLLSLSDRLEDFYILLFPIERSAENVNPSITLRCYQLRGNLSPYIKNTGYLTPIDNYGRLSALQHLLVESVSTELAELEQIDGVYLRYNLKNEVAVLKRRQVVFALPDDAAVPEEDFDEKAYETSIHEEAEVSSFQLDVWFPDRPAKRPWLIVGQESRMLVKLEFAQGKSLLSVPGLTSAEAQEIPDTIEYVDVLILCPDADVVPLRNRLQVPPRQGASAQFKVTPLREGKLPLTIVFMVQNDPIHRTPFYFEAREVESKEEGAPIEEVNTRE